MMRVIDWLFAESASAAASASLTTPSVINARSGAPSTVPSPVTVMSRGFSVVCAPAGAAVAIARTMAINAAPSFVRITKILSHMSFALAPDCGICEKSEAFSQAGNSARSMA
jgi:hypothetical protein